MEITLPLKPKVIHRQGNLAVFEIENLYPGYGITLGNAMRRVLLSSLSGASVTLMRIAGADHEFTTIPGVQEDVVTVALNVKQIRFRLFGEEPQMARLRAKGEKRLTAKDLEVPSQLEMVNPDTHIATLTSSKKSELDMELTIERGIGYVPVEMRQSEKLSIGTVAIDAIFTPVRKTNFSVENMRVGERTDFNRLRLDIETDGSITPEEALVRAAQILVDQFAQFADLLVPKAIAPAATSSKGESGETPKEVAITKQKIEDTSLSGRLKGALVEGGIKTVAGLAKKKKDDLLSMGGLGDKGIAEIEEFLQANGLSLKE